MVYCFHFNNLIYYKNKNIKKSHRTCASELYQHKCDVITPTESQQKVGDWGRVVLHVARVLVDSTRSV